MIDITLQPGYSQSNSEVKMLKLLFKLLYPLIFSYVNDDDDDDDDDDSNNNNKLGPWHT